MKRITIKTELSDDEAGDVAARIDDLLPDDYEISIEDITYHIHMLQTAQVYGGPEEGGWWDHAEWTPAQDSPFYVEPLEVGGDKEEAYAICRMLNAWENARREGLSFGYTSVLSYKEDFFSFDVREDADPVVYHGPGHYC